ncbi:MAG: glycoside hydrolase family 31 protein [Clostridiales bacterium]|nr:glycoside hydrolase family 31 protein [Clostridiales bacterium]
MNTIKRQLDGRDGLLTVDALAEGIYRIRLRRSRHQRESMLTRYGIIKTELPGAAVPETGAVSEDGVVISIESGGVSLTLDLSDTLSACYEDGGFRLRIPLEADERLFGLGDETRETLMKRGRKADLWQANVKSYGPIPYLMSSRGWGIMMNLTYRHSYDMGCDKADELRIDAFRGMADIYVFLAGSMKGVLDKYTSVSGRPVLLPKAAYGLTFVNNEEEGARDLLENCLMFRREKIPCDIMGLEPGWMSKHYDFSTDKTWANERFYQCYWLPKNYSGSWSMFYNLRQMGYKLSLWLCCDYDLLWKEEKTVREQKGADYDGAEITDEHFAGNIYMDKLTRPGEDWFEHLKRFVDQGAAAFKLDGANQVLEHPDRIWAGRYTDDEVHNVYPVIYGKQMKEGFEEHTGRRALIYTPSMYAGQQQYCATWAGDTGGGYKTMISIQNLAMCGHTNASCDLDVTQLSSIHYCFLMPWTQHLGWRNWQHPWFLGDELEGIYREYSQLRSSLFPYIYSAAHKAAECGLPIVRPLSLAYEGDSRFDEVLNEYMFGDSLLVCAFDMNMTLPEGRWTDWFTGKTYEGGGESFTYDPPKNKGGALMVRDGGIVVTQPWAPYLTHHDPTHYDVHIFPGNAQGEFILCEDDGETYAYKNGEVAKTRFTLSGDILTVSERTGSYTCVAEKQHMEENQESVAVTETRNQMPGLVPLYVKVHNPDGITGVTLNGEAVEFTLEDGCVCFTIPVSLHEKGEVVCWLIR